MVARFVDVFYRLRDFFSGGVEKIVGGYDRIDKAARRSANNVEASFKRSANAVNTLVAAARRAAAPLLAAFTFGAAARDVREFTNEADRLSKIGQKLGVTTEELSRIAFAAERNGIAFDTAAVALQRFTRRLAEVATTGRGQAAGALEALGLSAQQLAGLRIEDQLAQLADAFAAVEEQGERVRLAFQLFDTEGVDLVRVLQNGSGAFRELTERASELGGVIENETARAAEELNDRLTDIGQQLSGLFNRARAGAVRGLNDALRSLGFYVDRSEELQASLAELVAERERLENLSGRNIGARAELIAEIDREIAAVRRLIVAEAELEVSRARETRRNQTIAEDRKRLADTRSAVVTALENETEALKRELEEQTRELQAARREQLRIQQEFADLVSDVQAPPAEDVTGLDVQVATLEARRRLAEGDADAAIEAARKAADLLRDLKAGGEESGFVLSFLAKQLQEIATAAAKADTQAEVIDEQQAQAALDKVEQRLQSIQTLNLDVSPESLSKVYDQILATVQSATATGLRAAFDEVQVGRNYAGDIMREAQKRGVK